MGDKAAGILYDDLAPQNIITDLAKRISHLHDQVRKLKVIEAALEYWAEQDDDPAFLGCLDIIREIYDESIDLALDVVSLEAHATKTSCEEDGQG